MIYCNDLICMILYVYIYMQVLFYTVYIRRVTFGWRITQDVNDMSYDSYDSLTRLDGKQIQQIFSGYI